MFQQFMASFNQFCYRHSHAIIVTQPLFVLLSVLNIVIRQSRGGLAPVINVALHAQVPPSTGTVVGSAVTMAGVRSALLARGHRGVGQDGEGGSSGGGQNPQIAHAQVFYPFEYNGLHDRQWDLVIIEGWFKMINAFIHEVRALREIYRFVLLLVSTFVQTSLRHVEVACSLHCGM